jgi:Ca-activated chloride channel family protein
MKKKVYAGVVKKVFLIVTMSFLLTGWIDPLKDEVEKGNRNYQEGNFDNALEHYNKSEKYLSGKNKQAILNFNKGAAEYKIGNYEKGIELFNESLDSGNPDIQKKAYLNIGNSYVGLKKYDEAFKAYSRALKIDPSYEKAKKNIEYLLRKDEKRQENENDNNREGGEDNKNENDTDSKDEKNKDNNSGRDNESQSLSKKDISKEQMKNILESLKKKPLRRQKGEKGEYGEPEKAW